MFGYFEAIGELPRTVSGVLRGDVWYFLALLMLISKSCLIFMLGYEARARFFPPNYSFWAKAEAKKRTRAAMMLVLLQIMLILSVIQSIF